MITLFTHKKGPNGWKVVIVLEELGVQYESKYLEPGDTAGCIKGSEHLKLNPNGRIPTIIDHDNGDLILWESASIIRYIIERYDTDHKLCYPRGSNEAFLVDQWLTFQASGQGPYFGQIAWFKTMHPEKLPSAIERFQKEALRVASVLDGVLSKRSYLVGDKLTVADISFYPWNSVLFDPPELLGDSDSPFKQEVEQLKHFIRWHEEIGRLPSVQKAYGLRATF